MSETESAPAAEQPSEDGTPSQEGAVASAAGAAQQGGPEGPIKEPIVEATTSLHEQMRLQDAALREEPLDLVPAPAAYPVANRPPLGYAPTMELAIVTGHIRVPVLCQAYVAVHPGTKPEKVWVVVPGQLYA